MVENTTLFEIQQQIKRGTGWAAQRERPERWEVNAWRRLAFGVVYQAMKDAKHTATPLGDEARDWLLTDGLIWLDVIGFQVPAGKWAAWVKAGCPKLGNILRKANVLQPDLNADPSDQEEPEPSEKELADIEAGRW